ncbi:cullin-5 isoform X2 [Stigmatopora argus]
MATLLKNKGSLQFEDKWDLMRPIVLKLLRQESVTKQQWFDLFSDVHAVCLWDDKGPAKIHQALKEDILDFIKQAQARVLSHQDDTALLKAYIVEWRKFFTQCDILPKPFCQLEITLMGKQGSNKKSNVEDSIVRKLMLDTWNESIFSNIKNRLQDSAMKLVHAERLGEAFDSQLVIGVRESYVNLCLNPDDKLQIYRDNFEKAYMDSTERFYRTQAPAYLQQNGVQNYMKYADSKLREEEKRALRYLETRRDCNSVQALMECCVNALVTSFKETILAECPGMIKRNVTEKLYLMFSLMDKVPGGIDPMLKDLEEHIMSAGLADMVASAETITSDSEKYVEQLLTLFNRFSRLVKEAFRDDPRFLTARDKAYKAVVNDATIFKLELPTKQKGVGLKTQPESKCPELLANYCDMLLRKTPLSKKLTSEEIEAKLKEVLLVLKYVQNKDVFMRYHKAHLTRRLILDISADSEIEENMVEWLREVGMPADYVNKLARMFQDIKVSEDLNQSFKETHQHNKLALPADSVNIKILNAGAWSRSSEKVFVSLPTELEDLIPEVEDFYKKNHSGRKLHWHHLMSNGIVDHLQERGGPVRPGGDHLPAGRALRLEPEAQGEDQLREPQAGHRTARRRAATHALVPGGLPQAQAAGPVVRARGVVAQRLCRRNLILRQSRVFSHKKFQSSEAGKDQPDRSTPADHGAHARGGERGHRPAQDTENAGGHHPNHEDEEAHQQRPAADGAGGDLKEHVFTPKEDDQGADRMAHRPQVHQAGRGRHQHLHLHGVALWLWLWTRAWLAHGQNGPDGLGRPILNRPPPSPTCPALYLKPRHAQGGMN